MRDSRYRVIDVGDRVAYNRSGDVVEGVVIDVRANYALIEPHEDYRRNWFTSSYSKVKRGMSIIVLPR